MARSVGSMNVLLGKCGWLHRRAAPDCTLPCHSRLHPDCTANRCHHRPPDPALQEGPYKKPADAGAAAAAGPQIMGAILVFLPGWDEIVRLKDKLEGSPAFGGSRWGSQGAALIISCLLCAGAVGGALVSSVGRGRVC